MSNIKFYILLAAIFVLWLGFLYSQKTERNYMFDQLEKNTQRVISNQIIVHDTVKVKEVIHDTIKEYIKSTVYSSMIPSKVDTFEVHRGKTDITIEFADGYFKMDKVTEYQLLCNGSFYNKRDDEGTDWTNCNGEWIFKFKGERPFE